MWYGCLTSFHFLWGPCMRNFLLTRARTAFWIWSAPAILALLSCAASGLKGWALLTGYLLAIAWILAGWVVINFQPRIAMRPALAALDNRCDPEPLLELCRTVCRQNPDSLLFQVYQSWALSLLGKDKEALPVLDRVANHPRLTKDALALLVWSAALPSGDPRQEWAAEKLTALKPKMRANQRALVDQVINQRRSFALMQAAPPPAGAFAPAGSGAGRVPAGEGGSPYGAGGLLLPAGEMAAGADASGICAGQCQQAACPHPGGGTAV